MCYTLGHATPQPGGHCHCRSEQQHAEHPLRWWKKEGNGIEIAKEGTYITTSGINLANQVKIVLRIEIAACAGHLHGGKYKYKCGVLY